MRKRAWDYGRLALVNKDYEKYKLHFKIVLYCIYFNLFEFCINLIAFIQVVSYFLWNNR